MTTNHISKRALLTGGTGAIGGAIAEGLIRNGFEVLLPVRDVSKGSRTAEAINKKLGRAPMIEQCDLSSRDDIFALAERIQGPLHVLINNAAECPRRRTETAQGIEKQFATNVLGYFWMMTAFTPHLKKSAPARIVNVASYWAGGLDLNDPEFKQRPYDNDSAYRQSKQADRMLSTFFAQELSATEVMVNACHPGDVRSKLSSDLGFGGHESPDQGAATPLLLAIDAVGGEATGRYFAHLHEESCRFSRDETAISTLVDICDTYR
jgi:NAD(P)-dependent dehydrogenase (short-subunit alcohol dehydrogenase family)